MYIYVEIRLLVGTKFRVVDIVNFSLKIFILFKFVCVWVCVVFVCMHASVRVCTLEFTCLQGLEVMNYPGVRVTGYCELSSVIDRIKAWVFRKNSKASSPVSHSAISWISGNLIKWNLWQHEGIHGRDSVIIKNI